MAIRSPQWGRYVDYTWHEYRQQSDYFAAALVEEGLQWGDRVAILSENRFEWLIADQGVFSAGGVTVPLHTSLAVEQVVWQLDHSDSRWLVLSGEEQWQRLAPYLAEFSQLEGIIFLEPLKLPQVGLDGPVLLSWNTFLASGRHALFRSPKRVELREENIQSEDLATIIYTSGTTGEPKGVMLSHGNLVSNAVNRQKMAKYTSHDIKLSWLPYSHVYARTVDCFMSAYVGMTVVLARSPQTLREDLLLSEPTWMTGVPRFYEKIWRTLKPLSNEKRKAKLREIFGRRIRCVSCGGAPIATEIVEGFRQAGLPLLVGYGLTETSPVLTLNSESNDKPGTVGKAIPEVELKIASSGEVLVRGPQVMQGYWKDPGVTEEALLDGWLHTGDLGSLDSEGYLNIHGRCKDLIVTSQGKKIAPLHIEQLITADPAIEQAVVYGEGCPFLSAIIVPDFAYLLSVKGWEAPGSTVRGQGNGLEDNWNAPDVRAYLLDCVQKQLASVSREEQVRKIVVLDRPFSVSQGELTPSFKLRREQIVAQFQSLLDGLYY
nr:long-chain fatty acid--CoA ligase [Polystyrenella longa]